MKQRLPIFVLACWTAMTAHAALPDRLPAGYSGRLYGVASGLPEQTVQAFAQTPDHYLWIGTTGGLARFDGTHFTVFDRENTPAFQENSIFCLLAAKDGSLWIGTEGSGLVHYRDGAFRAYGRAEGLTDQFVRALAQDASGTVWVGTNNGLFRVDARDSGRATAIERVDAKGAAPAIAVNAICADSRGRLWLGGSRLAALADGALTIYPLPGDATRNRVKAVAETGDGTMWVGTVAGLYRMMPGENRFSAVPGIHGTTRGLRRTSDGRFWVSILGRGTAAYRIGEGGDLIDRTPVASDTVLTVFEDREQNVWLGMETGMLRLSRTPLTMVALPRASESDFGTVYEDRQGRLWAASTQLFRLNKGIAEPYKPRGMAGVKVREVYQTSDLSMWFGTDGSGLFHISGTGVRRYTASDGLVNNFIRAILQARDGTLWIGTDEGVSHFNGRTFVNYRMKDGLAYQSVRSMLEARNGDIWIGTELGLSHLHNDAFVNDAAVQALRQEKVWALHQDASGSIWIGTRNNGLFRLHDGSPFHYRVADGLASAGVLDIEEDRAGHFWMSGPNGISLLDRHELDRFAEHRATRLSLTFYSTSNDAETVQMFGGMQAAGALTANGDVWLPSSRGLVHLVQEREDQLPPAPLVINAVLVDGRKMQPADKISLAPGDARLEIDFASVMMRSQDSMRFRYKLDGLDRDWNEAGTRHVADYTNVPPGHYMFRVAAYDLSRPGVVSEASLTVVKLPHFYTSRWFVMLCVVVLSALTLALHRMRVAQVRRRFQAVLEERNRMAREVHDTILQGCTSVSAVLEAVSSVDRGDGVERALLASAREQIRTTINEAREAVWAMRHEREAPEDLAASMEIMRAQLSRECMLPIQCEVKGKPFAVTRPVAHELMMIAREAVHNAASHAAPTAVRVQLGFGAADLAVGVEDDGCGFEPDLVPPNGVHFGLTGMRERAAKLGGTFEVKSVPTGGTRITVCVPRDPHAEVGD